LIYIDSTRQVRAFDDFDLDLLSALGNHLAVAIERSRLQESALEKERLEGELAVAHDIQVGTLPSTMPEIPSYDLAGLCRPAAETGGDTFDLIPLEDGRLVLLVGDATGHGVGPALCATQVRAMLRIAWRLGASLDDAFRHINDQLAQDLADNRYVTAFLGLLDGLRHEVQYHSGGQGPIMIYRAGTRSFEWRSATTLPLGFFVKARLDEAETITLGPGDLLGLLTDGIFECENLASEMFGIARVEELIRENHERPMSHLAGALLQEARRFAGGRPQNDDITIVLLRRLTEPRS
jgi:phosphoserine phosphatase